MREFQIQRLINAGNELDTLVFEAGRILSRYVEPEGISADEALDALIYLFDGPQQRAAQKAWREAIDAAGVSPRS